MLASNNPAKPVEREDARGGRGLLAGATVQSVAVRALGAVLVLVLLLLGYVYGVSEWKLRRAYEAPLVPLRPSSAIDVAAGKRVAKIVGCWAGCHGNEGEGGVESIDGIVRITAPTLSQVLPLYSDEELVRLIRYGVKRDGRSAIGMNSFALWPLGDQDLADIIAHLRSQPVRPAIKRERRLTLRGRVALATGEWGVSAALVNRSVPRWGELPRRTAFERGRYLASIVCSECHGLDFRGNHLEGAPSLVIVAGYRPAQFLQLMRTGRASDGRDIRQMSSWLPDVSFTDRDIADLYGFLREYHGLGSVPESAFPELQAE